MNFFKWYSQKLYFTSKLVKNYKDDTIDVILFFVITLCFVIPPLLLFGMIGFIIGIILYVILGLPLWDYIMTEVLDRI